MADAEQQHTDAFDNGTGDGGFDGDNLSGGGSDWRDTIGNPDHRRFAERFTSPADMAKTAFEFRQKLSSAVVVPGKDASSDERLGFRRAIGIPDDPADYNVALPDVVPEEQRHDPNMAATIDSFLSEMHQAGAPPAAAQQAIDWYFNRAAAGEDATAKVAEKAVEDGNAALRAEWGGDYDVNVEYGRRAVREFGDQGFNGWLEGARADGVLLGDHPQFRRVFAAIGRRMAEDRPMIAGAEGARGDVEQQMEDLTAKAQGALERGDRNAANRLFADRDRLARRAYGTGSIAGG